MDLRFLAKRLVCLMLGVCVAWLRLVVTVGLSGSAVNPDCIPPRFVQFAFIRRADNDNFARIAGGG